MAIQRSAASVRMRTPGRSKAAAAIDGLSIASF
jgi:hypothetical protein